MNLWTVSPSSNSIVKQSTLCIAALAGGGFKGDGDGKNRNSLVGFVSRDTWRRNYIERGPFSGSIEAQRLVEK